MTALICLTVTLAEADLMTGVGLMFVGMLVVFAALSIIGVMIWGAGKWLRAEASVEAAPAAVQTPAPVEEGIDGRTLAVIAAAAAAVVGGAVRIRGISLARGKAGSHWSAAGRLGIHQSHNLRKQV